MDLDHYFSLLDNFMIETPSWGYADTGTRFGKFLQQAAASTIEEKLADAGQVHQFTGCCPTVAVHALWDISSDFTPEQVSSLAKKYGVKIGSINPNLFQNQIYKFGSACSSDNNARAEADQHVLNCIDIAEKTGSTVVSLWMADGTNYPGQDDIISRKHRLVSALQSWHQALRPNMQLLVEYKPFEPAFYETDIADWGMAFLYAKKAGPQAKVLVDTGHHLQGCNIEQIVAWLIDENMLGGFHFNDRKYADDDLTLGSIDPYALFRIFHEIRTAADLRAFDTSTIAYMIDQSHNLKPKIEATIQSVTTAQEIYLKACLVDRQKLAIAQQNRNIVDAEEFLKSAYNTDTRPILVEWRRRTGLPLDPLAEYRASGYLQRITQERKKPDSALTGSSYA